MGVVGCVELVVAGVCGESQIENLVRKSLHSFMGVDEFIHLFADRMHFLRFILPLLPFLFLLPSFLYVPLS